MTIPLTTMLGAFLIIGVRISGIVIFAPFFGSVAIPARVKPLLVITLTALLYPMLSPRVPALAISEWPMAILSELMIGSAVGVATNVVFDGIQMAGQILSVQLGYSLVNILDPQTQVESTVVATFHQTIAMLIFLRAGVHLWILRAVANSFDYLPVSSGHISSSFMAAAISACGAVFSIGVQIAAPVLGATLLSDFALAMLGKAAPQLPLMLLGPAVKVVPGLLILMAAMRYWPSLFEHLFRTSVHTSEVLLQLSR
ncbi:flagellar biosynthetic protein FliR [Granulicella sp. 5B5]|nr:flagellar biosynthetic protein FliR [Granulicella sp. 5B5]